MYAVLALLAAVENVIPPVPSDAAVALGAFLTNRGLTTPLGVFVVTWIANLAGAARGVLRGPALRSPSLCHRASAAACSHPVHSP